MRARPLAWLAAERTTAVALVRGRVEFSEYVRVNNIADVNYVGSVIVGDTNGRYYEPAPGRNWYAGVSISAAF